MSEMSDRTIERMFGRGREIIYNTDIPARPQWNKHFNNLVEKGEMEKAMKAARDMMNVGIEPDLPYQYSPGGFAQFRDFEISHPIQSN